MYEFHYTNFGYPSTQEIEKQALKFGFTHSFWATDASILYKNFYNGDTIVVYDNLDGMSEALREDALRHGEEINLEKYKDTSKYREIKRDVPVFSKPYAQEGVPDDIRMFEKYEEKRISILQEALSSQEEDSYSLE